MLKLICFTGYYKLFDTTQHTPEVLYMLIQKRFGDVCTLRQVKAFCARIE